MSYAVIRGLASYRRRATAAARQPPRDDAALKIKRGGARSRSLISVGKTREYISIKIHARILMYVATCCSIMEIQLDSSKPIYNPGDTIAGKLKLGTSKPKSYKEISIEFTGESQVQWAESVFAQQGTGHFFNNSSEVFAKKSLVLWSSKHSPSGKLVPGQCWPFSFSIPFTAPSSFTGTRGNISYSLVGKTFQSDSCCPQISTNCEPILIRRRVKLADKQLLIPVYKEVQKTLCCMCCNSGSITLTVEVPKTGFILGENLEANVSVENGSNRRLAIIARVTQRVVFCAEGCQQYDEKSLIEVYCSEVQPHKSCYWYPDIEVPSSGIDIIHENTSGNIRAMHFFNITCKIPHSLDLSTAIPLKLAHERSSALPPTITPQQKLTSSPIPHNEKTPLITKLL